MDFFTKIPIQKSKTPIDYSSKLVLLGSCFTENMGEKLNYFKFQATVNPFGIIFNPVSLEKLVGRCIENNQFTESDIFFHNELWHCFEVHSELSNPDKAVLLQNLNNIILSTQQQLKAMTHCIITLGSAWVYKAITTNQIVANCHKVPQNQFTKELLTVLQIEESLQRCSALIQSVNPKCNIILTVSPVRHLKDGFVENQISKAHLITSLHSVLKHFNMMNYFPSYEIIMDELRDYRYYASDLLHLNQVAVDYIWEKFSETTIDESAIAIMSDVELVQKGLAHRPFNPTSKAHLAFLEKIKQTIKKIEALPYGIKFLSN